MQWKFNLNIRLLNCIINVNRFTFVQVMCEVCIVGVYITFRKLVCLVEDKHVEQVWGVMKSIKKTPKYLSKNGDTYMDICVCTQVSCF